MTDSKETTSNHLPVTRIRGFLINYLNEDAHKMSEKVLAAGDAKFAETEGLKEFLAEWDEDFPKLDKDRKVVPNVVVSDHKTAESLSKAIISTCKFRLGQPTAAYAVACMEEALRQLMASSVENMLTHKQHYLKVCHIVNKSVVLKCNSAGLFRDLPTWRNTELEQDSREAHEIAQKHAEAIHKLKNKGKDKPAEFKAENWRELQDGEKFPRVGPTKLALVTYIVRVWKSVLDQVKKEDSGTVQFTTEAKNFLQDLMVDLINRLCVGVRHVTSRVDRKTVSHQHFGALIGSAVESTGGKSFEILSAGDSAHKSTNDDDDAEKKPTDDKAEKKEEQPKAEPKKPKKKKDKKKGK